MRYLSSSLATSAVVFSTLVANTSFAEKDFTCTSKNDSCVIYDKSVVTGDQVGFFTDRGELIATGKVTKMDGTRRSVQLQQVMGPVKSQADTYAMLDGPSAVHQEKYRIYKQQAPAAIAGHIGMATLGAGSDAKGYEVSAEIIRRRFLGKVDGFARGSLYSFSGTAENVYADVDQGIFSSTSVAGLTGLAYTLFSQNDFYLRTEVGLGLSYTVAKINNSVDDARSEDWGYGVKSGFAPHARGMIAGGHKFDGWQVEAGFAPALLAGKSATSIGAGLMVNLK